ncbi:MAG TPA: alanine--tRNA ligase [Candidatus Limnocylindrales bacterium]|nr:alanine--tRNA ligase [Candidatus Limnocylindrales bacterium]
MQTNAVRDIFLDFFKSKEHLVMPSFSLIPQNDPSLLLIGAGMAPLKTFFTGEKKPPHPRLATCQKCVRTPDIDRVGHTGRHATFFEMLGNFSFGDYFKEEAIAWAWELVLNGYRLPLDRLWVSVYLDDDEAFKIWNEQIGVPAERIKRFGKKDNFWEIGLGPCGPCSEIYYDLGEGAGCGSPDCAVGCDCDRYLEIWNLVFTQFSREASGELVELKQKNIDTGAGLERVAMALQGVYSLYETDQIRPLYHHFRSAIDPGRRSQEVPLRIVTEHSRGTIFLIADGVVPSNEGRGYVLRRLLRRAVRYGRLLGMEGNFITGAVPLVVDTMASVYPQLAEKQDYISQVVKLEEQRFQDTLAQGMEILDGYIDNLLRQGETVLPGGIAFKLYDTYGFPLDLTAEILEEQGLKVNREAFAQGLQDQQTRARAATRSTAEEGGHGRYKAAENLTTIFTGYETLEQTTRIQLALVGGEARTAVITGEKVEVLLEQTPFYAEAGGQAGDTGVIIGPEGQIIIENTFFSPWGQIIHQGIIESGSVSPGDTVVAKVEGGRRKGICRSHTATHLLHRALRDKLGDHASQAGSLVASDRFRFDFTHFSSLSGAELRAIEEQVNSMVLANAIVEVSKTTLEEAKQMGAAAIFTDKYAEDAVRMVSAGQFTRELCGGTHVSSTGEVGLFRIVSEEGIGSGMRRIEALTGMGAYRQAVEQSLLLENMAELLHTTPPQLVRKVKEHLADHRQLVKTNQELQQQLAGYAVQSILSEATEIDGVKMLSAAVSADNLEALRLFTDEVKSHLGSAVVVLGAVSDGRVLLVGTVTPDLVSRGIHAHHLIKEVARQVDGGGGGKPELAQAGGKNPDALPAALNSVAALIRKQLKSAGSVR